MCDITITVFTPTYNRADLLRRLYTSLTKQTDKDFLWSVVDDGSVDNTEEVVSEFINEGILSINYVKIENGGKYKAHNYGVKICNTELFVCVDSDDTLLPDAIEKTKKEWQNCKHDKNICGIVSPRKLIGEKKFINPPYAGTLMQLYNDKIFSSDTMLVYRSDVLKAHLFPEIDGEKFMTESVIYYQIDQKYKLRYFNEFLYEGEYQDSGLSNSLNTLHLKNPVSTMIAYKNTAAYQTDFVKAIKAYACFLSWKKLFSLEDMCPEFKIKWYVKLCGSLFKFRYYKRFKNLKER